MSPAAARHLAGIERLFRAACMAQARFYQHWPARRKNLCAWIKQAREHHRAVLRLMRMAKTVQP